MVKEEEKGKGVEIFLRHDVLLEEKMDTDAVYVLWRPEYSHC